MLIYLVAIKINNEPWIPRSISNHATHLADSRFCHEVRNRNRKCGVSGLINAEVHIKANNWLGFKQGYIFPPEHEGLGLWVIMVDPSLTLMIPL